MIFSELQAGAKLVIGIAIFTFIVGSITAVYFWHRSKVNTAVATAVDKMIPLLKTKDNRNKAAQGGNQQQSSAQAPGYSDDLPDWM